MPEAVAPLSTDATWEVTDPSFWDHRSRHGVDQPTLDWDISYIDQNVTDIGEPRSQSGYNDI